MEDTTFTSKMGESRQEYVEKFAHVHDTASSWCWAEQAWQTPIYERLFVIAALLTLFFIFTWCSFCRVILLYWSVTNFSRLEWCAQWRPSSPSQITIPYRSQISYIYRKTAQHNLGCTGLIFNLFPFTDHHSTYLLQFNSQLAVNLIRLLSHTAVPASMVELHQ